MNYLALDIGNVLCALRQETFNKTLSEIANIEKTKVNEFLNEIWCIHDLGHTSIEKEVKSRFNIKSEILLSKINNAWKNTIIHNEIVIDFFKKLQIDYDIKVALLSNIGIEHIELVKNSHLKGWYGNFYHDCIKYFSCDVGARKPTYLYYQTFLSMYPEFKGCMYIDDLHKNLEIGELFGFKPYCFDQQRYLLEYHDGTTYFDEKSLEKDLEKIKSHFLKINNLT